MRALQTALIALLAVTGCAGREVAATAPDAQAATPLDDLRPEQVAGVEPLWVPNRLTRAPAYTLGGVIVALRAPGEGACEAGQAAAERPVLVLRAEDPVAARALLERAEALAAAR